MIMWPERTVCGPGWGTLADNGKDGNKISCRT